MAERKAVNKYYPPEWTPSKGSINKFLGTHALRERARKLHQGILIIRFEMPFNIWCEGCENHVGMGVRYNAEKSKVGMYYTTPIYKFRMKCHLCTNHYEIQTDPQNLDYVILSGARRQERRWDPEDNDQVAPEDKNITRKMATDAMFRLEHGVEDKAKTKAVAPNIVQLEELQERWKDDFMANQVLRKQFREKKKEIQNVQEKDNGILKRLSLDIPLLPENPNDTKIAQLLRLTPIDTFENRQLQKRLAIEARPLFPNAPHTKVLPHRQRTESESQALNSATLGIVQKCKRNASSSSLENLSACDAEISGSAGLSKSNSTPKLVSLDYGSSDSEG